MMGNYKHLELDFVNRTLRLIAQYENELYKYPFEHQYNYTLLINCLLGLIVLPKENAISHLPNDRITNQLKDEMGIVHSIFNPELMELRSLIVALRNSIAHFDIHIVSEDERFLIDKIVFKDKLKSPDYVAATFVPGELLSFMRYYAGWFTKNLKDYPPEALGN